MRPSIEQLSAWLSQAEESLGRLRNEVDLCQARMRAAQDAADTVHQRTEALRTLVYLAGYDADRAAEPAASELVGELLPETDG